LRALVSTFIVFYFLSTPIKLTAQTFKESFGEIKGILDEYCSSCHNPEKKKGSLDFSSFTSFESIYRNRRVWQMSIEQLMNQEMPPAKKKQPSEDEKHVLMAWIEKNILNMDCSSIRDPGHIVIRRLNPFEYDNTIFDLTGLDLKLAQNFPVQGGGGEGFDNNSEVMFFPAIYMEKYVEAAQKISSHAKVSYTKDIEFALEPDVAKNPAQYQIECDFSTNKFYAAWRLNQPKIEWQKELETYTIAAMQLILKHPQANNLDSTMFTFAAEHHVNVAYLENLRSYLANTEHKNIWAFWSMREWLEVLKNKSTISDDQLRQMAALFVKRNKYIHQYRNPKTKSKLETLQLSRADKLYLTVGDIADGNDFDYLIVNNAKIKFADGQEKPLIDCKVLSHLGGGNITLRQRINNQPLKFNKDEETIVNGLELKAPAQVCFELPENAQSLSYNFGVSDLSQGNAMLQVIFSLTAPSHPLAWEAEGVLLAGPGQALSKHENDLSWIDDYINGKVFDANNNAIEKMLTEPEKIELEQLKNERNLSNRHPEKELEKLIAKNHLDSSPLNVDTWPEAEKKHYQKLNDALTKTKQTLNEKVLQHLFIFAQKSMRKPLSPENFEPLKQIYLEAMKIEDNFQKAARLVITKILISPDFLYRYEEDQLATEPMPINDVELANRLSYFIWGSMPDDTLMQVAIAGQLQNDDVLTAQVKRMLKDKKALALFDSFVTQWLGLQQLKGERRPNANLYSDYNDDIRNDMIAEAKHFFQDFFSENRPLLDLLNQKVTYLNQRLANYYHIPNVEGPHFRKVNVEAQQRGGLLGLGAVHVLTSYPDRTSPVLRGQWILETLLGNPTPPPPENVVIDQAKMANANMSVKERLTSHRENPSCAICHDRLDPIGFTLENFDASGRLRTKDGAHDIDTLGELKNGTKIQGMVGLRTYFNKQKHEQFVTHFTAKLLGYALGRSLDYYDDCVIKRILEQTKPNQYRIDDIILAVAKSLPFRFRRGLTKTAHALP